MNHPDFTLEVCCDSVQSAINAEKGGAARIELCDNLFEGGTTPSYGTIALARQQIDIDMNVIIRPRGGDFCYSDLEFQVMKQDIETAKQLGANGMVSGILTPDGKIDQKRTAELVERVRPLSFTFHRAFDMVEDPYKSIEIIIDLGIERLLTSGLASSVLEGIDLITDLQRRYGDQIKIMPGGGIREHNIQKIVEVTNVSECHVSGSQKIDSRMTYRNQSVFMGKSLRPPEYQISVVDPDRIEHFKTLSTNYSD